MTVTTERDIFGNFVTVDSDIPIPATPPTANFVEGPINAFSGNAFSVWFDLKHPSVLASTITVSTLTVTGPAGSAPIVTLGEVLSLGTNSGYRVQWIINPLNGQEGFYTFQILAGAFTSSTPIVNAASDIHSVRVFTNPFAVAPLAPSWSTVFQSILGTYPTDPEIGGYNRYRIPVLFVAGNGDVLFFAEARELGDLNKVDIVYKRSTDNGETWGSDVVIAASGSETNSNVCPILDETTNRIHLFYTFDEATMRYRFSDDNGLTWSADQDLTTTLTADFIDDIFLASTNRKRYRMGPGGGIQIKNGEHRGRLVCAAHIKLTTTTLNRAIVTAYSDDGGTTWISGEYAVSGAEPHLAERSDGSTITVLRNQDLFKAPNKVVSRSTDGGATWGQFDVVGSLPAQVCQNSIKRLWFDNENSDRNVLLLTSLDSTDVGSRSTLFAALSLDDGATWPTSMRRVLYPYWGAYSDSVLLPDGYIGIACEKDQTFFKQNLAFTKISLNWLLEENNDQFFDSLTGIVPPAVKTGNWTNFSAGTRNGWSSDAGNTIGQYYEVINIQRIATTAANFTNTGLGTLPTTIRCQFALRIDAYTAETSSSVNAGFRLTFVRNNARSYFLIADNGVHYRSPTDTYPLIAPVATEVNRWYEWRLDVDYTNNITTVFRDGLQLGTYPIEEIGFSANYIRFLPPGDSAATTYGACSIAWGALDDNLS